MSEQQRQIFVQFSHHQITLCTNQPQVLKCQSSVYPKF
jgi:hypothetical protein